MPLRTVFLAIILTGATAIAHAQPKPALTNDISSPGHDIYRQSVTLACTGILACNQTLPLTVPAGKRLVITGASFQAELDAASTEPVLGDISVVDATDTYHLWITAPGTGTIRRWNSPVTQYVGPSDVVIVALGAPIGRVFNTVGLYTLVGHFVTP